MAKLFSGMALRGVLEERLSRVVVAPTVPSPRRRRTSWSNSSTTLGLTPLRVEWSAGVVVPATLVLIGPEREPHFRSLYAVPFVGSRELFHYRPDGLPDDAAALDGDVVNQTVVLTHCARADDHRMRDGVRGWDAHQRWVNAVVSMTNRQLTEAQDAARRLMSGEAADADELGRPGVEGLLAAG